MSVITIYAVAKYKPKEGFGCYGFLISKDDKKPVEYSGHFDSESVIETQLKSLMLAFSLVKKPFDMDEIIFVTESLVVGRFLNGRVKQWESQEWLNSTDKPIEHADLWKEFLELYEGYPITLTKPNKIDIKYRVTSGLVTTEIQKLGKEAMKDDLFLEEVTNAVEVSDEKESTKIYVTVFHIKREKYACFAISIYDKEMNLLKEFDGQFDSDSKIEAQVSVLIYAIRKSLRMKKMKKYRTIEVFSDITAMNDILNGKLDQWSNHDWVDETEKPVSKAEWWKILNMLIRKNKLVFTKISSRSQEFSPTVLKAKAKVRDPKRTSNLFPDMDSIISELDFFSNVSENATKPHQFVEVEIDKNIEISPSTLEMELSHTIQTSSDNTDSTITVDPKLLEKCDILFNEIGLNTKTAINMFLKHSIRQKGLTLDLKLE